MSSSHADPSHSRMGTLPMWFVCLTRVLTVKGFRNSPFRRRP